MITEQENIQRQSLRLSKDILERIGLYQLKEQSKSIISISGESGSGKTITANGLSMALMEHGIPSYILHMDDYFLLPAADNHKNRLKSLKNVGPHEVNLALVEQHMQDFLHNKHITAPVSDFHGNRLLTKQVDFNDTQVLIAEGTYILSLHRPMIRIFLERDYRDTLDDRISRGREPFNAFVEEVLEIEHQIIRKYRNSADIVIDKTFNLS